MALRRSIRITKVNLTHLIAEQGGEADALENAFLELQTSLTISTEKDRDAAEAESTAAVVRAEANIAQAKTAGSFLRFLRLASGCSNLVATERNWMPPFRDKDGNICIENPFTLRDQRAAAHAMHNQLAKQAGSGEDGGGDDLDIYSEDDERT